MIVKKPTIVIYTCQPDAALLSEVCAGIEEEGVLCEVTPQFSKNATVLAADASEASMLGAGIGLCGKALSLHIKGMKPEDAIFSFAEADAGRARDLGANSARVIKRLPFRMDAADEIAR